MIDLEELRKEIQSMTYQSKIFRVLKEELSLKGYWRNLKRGNPQLGYKKMKDKLNHD